MLATLQFGSEKTSQVNFTSYHLHYLLWLQNILSVHVLQISLHWSLYVQNPTYWYGPHTYYAIAKHQIGSAKYHLQQFSVKFYQENTSKLQNISSIAVVMNNLFHSLHSLLVPYFLIDPAQSFTNTKYKINPRPSIYSESFPSRLVCTLRCKSSLWTSCSVDFFL